VGRFLGEATAQWRNLAVEVRSVRSMLEEVISNWDKYSSTVAALQAWLEDAEQTLNQSEDAKRVSAAITQCIMGLFVVVMAILRPC
jgi:nesprin-1